MALRNVEQNGRAIGVPKEQAPEKISRREFLKTAGKVVVLGTGALLGGKAVEVAARALGGSTPPESLESISLSEKVDAFEKQIDSRLDLYHFGEDTRESLRNDWGGSRKIAERIADDGLDPEKVVVLPAAGVYQSKVKVDLIAVGDRALEDRDVKLQKIYILTRTTRAVQITSVDSFSRDVDRGSQYPVLVSESEESPIAKELFVFETRDGIRRAFTAKEETGWKLTEIPVSQ